ncbi:MAG: nucleotidyltransferase family protein [Acidobacteriia bacterium]|nr:nucleotidyltransferase family protein [Terriglobia bacterium]
METSCQPEIDFNFLSELVLTDPASPGPATRIAETVLDLNPGRLEAIVELAAKNHVIIRAFSRLSQLLKMNGSTDVADWVSLAIEKENSRIRHALGFLNRICATLEQNACPVTVIKSLDHWPDLGSDLDLYTDAEPARVVDVMFTKLAAKVEQRSWGDRLANKWNFLVPGLPELVEVHIGRLGQTGEQTAVTESLSRRTRVINVGQYSFRVLAPEDRIIISTLQRMYRHFYIRLCDVIDNATLVESECVDFTYLHRLGSAAGIWEGIATYLTIISGYVKSFRGRGIALPAFVTGSTKFGVDKVHYRRDFLRVPILPHSMNLYAGELKTLLMRGEVRNSLRLSLLPGLATAAALELKILGSDKGIW